MEIKREIRVVFLALMIVTLTCPGGFAERTWLKQMQPEQTSLEKRLKRTWLEARWVISSWAAISERVGKFFCDSPRGTSRSYLQKYISFPQGFLADSH